MSERRLSVLILDDHRIFSESLRILIESEPGFEVAATFRSGREALDYLRAAQAPIDVIIADLYIPGEELGQTLAAMRRLAPKARLICVTASTGLSDARLATQSGADEVVLKHATPETLLAACRGAEVERDAASDPSAKLRISPRQMDVLRGLSRGLSNKQIANQLGVSPETVKSHVSDLLRQSGASGRGALVYWASRNGVLLDD